MKPIEQLTPDALRRALAERLGYEWTLLTDDAAGPFEDAFRGDLWTRDGELVKPPPDWPHDVGAALELVERLARDYGKLFSIAPPFLVIEWYDNYCASLNAYGQIFYSTADTPALALSRLALTVLRAREEEREP